jgi:hypothetical protein
VLGVGKAEEAREVHDDAVGRVPLAGDEIRLWMRGGSEGDSRWAKAGQSLSRLVIGDTHGRKMREVEGWIQKA